MLNRVKCATGKHTFYELKKCSASTWKVGCLHCDSTWAMNYDLRVVVPWDKEFDELYGLIDKTNGDEA